MSSSMRLFAPVAPALAGAPLLLALLLAGCGPDTPQFAPDCRKVLIPADAADLTVFGGRGTDITDMVLDGRITGVPLSSKCAWSDGGNVRATVSVGMALNRGPAMKGRDVDVPYFIAVARGDEILNKRSYRLHVHFPGNEDAQSLTTDEVTLDLPLPGKASPRDYQILAGFQLTPDELAFNRRRGPR